MAKRSKKKSARKNTAAKNTAAKKPAAKPAHSASKRQRDQQQASVDPASATRPAPDATVIAVDFGAAHAARRAERPEATGPAEVIDFADHRQRRLAQSVRAAPLSQTGAVLYDAEIDHEALGAALLKLIEESERR